MQLNKASHNKRVKKNPDNYNRDALGSIALVINHDSMSHLEKQEKIMELIDAVYVDGWNHGYKMVTSQDRETNTKLRTVIK